MADSTNRFRPDIFGAAPPTNRWTSGEGGAVGRARKAAQGWLEDASAQYRKLHPGTAKDYITSDVGKSAFRASAGHTVQTLIQRRLKRAQRKGGIVSNMLYNFANIAMSGMMRRLKDDQATFENVARVRRGDPDVFQMSHNELRSVLSHAQKYGGHDAADVHAKATSELNRRWEQKASEHAGYDQRRYEHLQAVRDVREQQHARNAEASKSARRQERDRRRADVAKQQMEHRQALHEQKLRHVLELRTASGRGAAAKADVQAQVRAAGGASKQTGGGGTTGPLQVVGETKKGNLKVKTKTGRTRVATKEEVAASRKPRGGGGVTPIRRTSRKRSV